MGGITSIQKSSFELPPCVTDVIRASKNPDTLTEDIKQEFRTNKAAGEAFTEWAATHKDFVERSPLLSAIVDQLRLNEAFYIFTRIDDAWRAAQKIIPFNLAPRLEELILKGTPQQLVEFAGKYPNQVRENLQLILDHAINGKIDEDTLGFILSRKDGNGVPMLGNPKTVDACMAEINIISEKFPNAFLEGIEVQYSKGQSDNEEEPVAANPQLFPKLLPAISLMVRKDNSYLLQLADIENGDGTPLFFNIYRFKEATPLILQVAKTNPQVVRELLSMTLTDDEGSPDLLKYNEKTANYLLGLIPTDRGEVLRFLEKLASTNSQLFREVVENMQEGCTVLGSPVAIGSDLRRCLTGMLNEDAKYEQAYANQAIGFMKMKCRDKCSVLFHPQLLEQVIPLALELNRRGKPEVLQVLIELRDGHNNKTLTEYADTAKVIDNAARWFTDRWPQ